VILIRIIADGLLFFLQVYSFIVLARIILSWFMLGGAGNQTLSTIYQVVYGLTEPLLAPIRKLIPPIKMGMAYLDLSPFILLILISIARQLVFRYIFF
jgi:YggT family protein